jgi:A/G-specific adenine glycosylase
MAPEEIQKNTPPLADEEPGSVPEAKVAALRRALLRWYDEEHRPLPWRTEPSEYATVVSEFMLQQTQVATVLPFFENFMSHFPDFKHLADAAEQDVLRLWSGLGYYRRARLLKRTAEVLVRRYGGRLPRDPKELAMLPGFGDYTVGAVGSIALGLPLPLVDGNVRRVVGRLFALAGDLTQGAGKKKLWAICGQLVDPERPGDFNQGLMDLGATVCIPREPLCLVCPLFEQCRARAIGYPDAYPAPVVRPPVKTVREVAVALIRQGKTLVLQRGEEGSFAGMWELPRLDSREVLEEQDLTPGRVLFDLVRVRANGASLLGRADSTFTNHRIRTELYRMEDAGSQAVRRQRHVAHRWAALSTLEKLPASRAQHRLFSLLGKAQDVEPGEPEDGNN